MKSLNTVLLESVETRWTLSDRINNRYFLDTKSRLLAFCGWKHMPLDGLTLDGAAQLVQEYLDERRNAGLSPQSLDNDRRNISSAFTWASKRGLLPWRGNPCSLSMLHMPRVIIRCKRPVDADDMETMLVRCRVSPILPQVLLCICAGMRPIGACRVSPDDVDRDDRSCRCIEKGRERIVPLHDMFFREMDAWTRAGWKWKHWHESTVMKYFRRIKTDAGMPEHVTLQAFRRTFLKACLEGGIEAQMAARIAGNSIGTIQKHYVQLGTLNARNAVNKLVLVK